MAAHDGLSCAMNCADGYIVMWPLCHCMGHFKMVKIVIVGEVKMPKILDFIVLYNIKSAYKVLAT